MKVSTVRSGYYTLFKKYPSLNPLSSNIYKALHLFVTRLFRRTIIRLLKTREDNQVKYWGARFHENKQRLQDAFEVAPDLLEAYDSLQFFHDILASWPYSVQYEELTEWIKQYTASDVEEIHSAACTIRHWRGYIQNSWKYGKPNGLSEGLNNKVKVLKRVAFGLHSFESFRKRILLTCGKLRLSKDPLSVLEDARNGKEIRL